MEQGLIGCWNFNEISDGNIVIDHSGQGNDGSISGDVELVDSYAF
jgi:hypothetical protein